MNSSFDMLIYRIQAHDSPTSRILLFVGMLLLSIALGYGIRSLIVEIRVWKQNLTIQIRQESIRAVRKLLRERSKI